MKINNYISSLLPVTNKNGIIEDMRLTKAEIVEHTEPAYKTAVELLSNWKFKSEPLKKVEATFSRMVKTKGNMIVVIHESIKDILSNLDHVEKLINSTFNEEMTSGGFTYKSTTLMQLSEGFVNY